MMLRLAEQACGLVHNTRRRRTQGACSSLPPALRNRHLQVFGRCIVSAPSGRSDWPSKLAAASWCKAKSDARCVHVSAAGAQVKSAGRHDQAPEGLWPLIVSAMNEWLLHGL